MTQLISREKLEYIAKKVLHYPLHDAEKDYFLALAMKLISQSSLSEQLVFKGGTAIYHCYLDQLRFSEDLDFTSLDKNIQIKDIRKILIKDNLFEVKKEYESKRTFKIEKLKYYGVLDTPNSIKFEVDHFQNVVLSPVKKEYKNVWGISFSVNVMDSTEICTEKLRACNDRFRYRDFYDLYMIVKTLDLNLKDIISLIPQKEIRKPFSKKNVTENLNFALNEISEEGDTVSYEKDIARENLIKFFNSLKLPTLMPSV
jgi:predicted nucleotidyltransferase component of viral defense system